MLGHGFYMLIMISSYVANLASVLSQRDNSMDFSGWYEGNKPIVARMEDIELSIPLGTSQVAFIHHEEVAEGRKFMRVDCYETWEESMDAVLCGEAPAAFHDEAMVLYYLNHHLPAFARGAYTPRIGNCETERNPHELKHWGSGKRYVWGAPGVTGQGSRECSLAMTGEVFHTSSYAFGFGFDHAAAIPFSEAILFLRENHNLSKIFDDGGIGTLGMDMVEGRCSNNNENDDAKFKLDDFIGLYIIMGIFFAFSIATHFITVHPFFHVLPKDIDPNDLGGSRRLLRRKVLAPGVHKTGPDRFNEAGRGVEMLNDNQDEMNKCLEEMLRILGPSDSWREGAGVVMGVGELEDKSQGMLETNSASSQESPRESPQAAELEEGRRVSSVRQGKEGAGVQTSSEHRMPRPVLRKSSASDALAQPVRRTSKVHLSGDALAEVQGPEMKEGVPWLEPSASEPSMSFSSLRARLTRPASLLRRTAVSSDTVGRTAADHKSNVGQ